MGRTTEAKEARASVRIVYRHYDVLKDGTCPFFVCITKERKRKYVATGLTLHPDFWDAEKEKIRRNYPHDYRKRLEKALQEWKDKYEKAADFLADADEKHDVKTVASKAVEDRKQTRRVDLLAYVEEVVLTLRRTRQTGTAETYTDVQKQIAAFLRDERNGATDVHFDRISVSFCQELESYLRGRGNTDNTLSQRFRVLRAILNRAIAGGAMKADKYPFARNVAEKHKFSVGKFDTSTVKRAISRDDVRKIEAYPIPAVASGKYASLNREHKRQQRAKDIFLFSFYAAGINFVDLAKLRWANVSTDAAGNLRISFVRQKTGGKFSFRLIAPAVAIVERYRLETFTGPDSYVFPVLSLEAHSTPEKINNRLHKVLGETNTDLKAMGKIIGLATPLTTYVARHSFATNLKRAGHANALIGQALGHKDEATTNIYLDSFGSDAVDAAFDSLL